MSILRSWSQDLENALRYYVDLGMNSAFVRTKLNMNRNQIASRMHKLGLSFKTEKAVKQRQAKELRKRVIAGEIVIVKEEPADKHRSLGQDPFNRRPLKEDVVFTGSVWTSLFVVKENQCRWPIDGNGEDGFPRCCGAPVAAIGLSWCIDHLRLVKAKKVSKPEQNQSL
jgi:hypothetical protein